MQIDPSLQSKADNYKILTKLVVPRPIAWVSTMSFDGIVNLAPFSFFNAVSADPLYVAIYWPSRRRHAQRHRAQYLGFRRIRGASGDRTITYYHEYLCGKLSARPKQVSAAGLETSPSLRIKVPRLVRAQASMECALFHTIALGPNTLIIGEVAMFHVIDDLVAPGLHIDHFAPIGRLGSPSVYCRTTDRFELPRVTYSPTQQGN